MWLRCLTTAFKDVADAMQIGDRHMLKKSTTVERGT